MRFAAICIFMSIAIPAMAGTWMDDFNDGDMDEWLMGGNGNWEIIDGELVISPNDANSILGFSIGETSWKNYTAEVKMKITKMNHILGFGLSAGISLRSNFIPGSGYVAGLGVDPPTGIKQAEILVGRNFLWVQVQPGQFDWVLNQWYRLKASAEDNLLKLYIDDKLVVEFTNNLYPTGDVGIGATSTATAYFDDFVVTGDDVPDQFTTVPPRSRLTATWGQIRSLR